MQQLGASSSLIHTRTTASTLGAAAGVAGELGGMASVCGAGAATGAGAKLRPKTPTQLLLEVSLQVS